MLAAAGRKTGLIMTNTRKRHTPEQVVRKLGQADRMLADGADVAAVCRELGMSEQTYYRWRNQYGGLKADDAKRLTRNPLTAILVTLAGRTNSEDERKQ